MADDYGIGEVTNGRVVVGGPAMAGQIETAGDSDWFRVDVTAGQRYTFTLTAAADGLVEPFLELMNVEGEWVDFVSVRDGQPATLKYTPSASGAAYLNVGEMNNGEGTGSYTVAAVALATRDDYPADATTTGLVAVNGPKVTGLIDVGGDMDFIRVDLLASATYTFTCIEALSGGEEPVLSLQLLDSELARTGFEFDAWGGGAGGTVSDFTPTTSGTYYISLRGYPVGAATGNYSVSVATTNGFVGTAGDDMLSGAAGTDSLSGLAGDDILDGGAGDDILDGGAGADTLDGGAGNDRYVVVDDADIVIEDEAEGGDRVNTTLPNYTLPANVEIGRVLATDGARLAGNDLDNVLYAGAGGDTLVGGAGADCAAFQYAGGAVTVSLMAGTVQATGGAGSVLLQGIENLYGSRGDDQLTGNNSDNQINGGAGADTLAGAGGNDIYLVHHVGSVIEETVATDGGRDIVHSTARSFTLGDGVEDGRVRSDGYADLIGNTGKNLLYAGAGHSMLDGKGGKDTVSFLYADAGVQVGLNIQGTQHAGSAGVVKLVSIENLIGSKYDDWLTGDAADNILNGGDGSDTLTGGVGRDVFRLNSLVSTDSIEDFLSGTDRLCIDQSAIALGNGDTKMDGAILSVGTSGFAASAELVVITDNIGTFESDNVAAQIGSADAAYSVGTQALFVVDNGVATALYLFTAADADALVSSDELKPLAYLNFTPATTLGDFLFGA